LTESLFHSFENYLIPDQNGSVKIWSVSRQSFVDKAKNKSGSIILLTPGLCEYSIIDTRLSSDDKKNIYDYVEWHFKREFLMKTPIVDWVKTKENKLLCFASESEVIEKARKMSLMSNTVIKGIDGLNTLIINAGRRISDGGENTLISIIGVEDITIIGFTHGKVLFLRGFKISNTFSFEKELMSTLAYYGFSPIKKIIFHTDKIIPDEGHYYLYDNKIFGRLCNEKLSF